MVGQRFGGVPDGYGISRGVGGRGGNRRSLRSCLVREGKGGVNKSVKGPEITERRDGVARQA